MEVRDASAGYVPQVDMPEVPDGYKQTELGMIPEDWKISTLGEICSFENGDRSSNYPSPRSFRQSGIPFINAGHVADGKIFKTAMNYITQDAYDRLGGGKVKAGDILFCLRGSLGKFGSVDSDFGYGAIASSLVIIRCIKSEVSREFLRCYLGSALCSQMIDVWSGGAAQPNLGARELARFVIHLPPIPEQRTIATALSDVDALLEALDRLIAKKRYIKQATMQQLLTAQIRLPGFDGEWEVKRLGEIARIKTGSRNNEDKSENGEYPFFVRSENVERINSYAHDCEAILVPGEGRIGEIFHYVDGRFDVHQRVYAITQFKPGISAKFVYVYMRMKFGVWAMQNTVKATVDSLRLPTFLNFEMLVPPTQDEQSAIATILGDMDVELETLRQRRTKTAALKQAMMQELLTGRTRLVEPEQGESAVC